MQLWEIFCSETLIVRIGLTNCSQLKEITCNENLVLKKIKPPIYQK
ncbi:MAG: hypothetical protein MRERC_4c126 [Mycoplasmataceae bacterium RC_NB112A]|nr:MAG: hypothetical protein MRERC_10c032 [Mycoplasmataceae bacterium RC_NB112A]KLL01963.1 MAG: hypothetical protein MRERC_6c056 [Mycoplasmataceae bacterium RC_NB112A]KLL02160.1 MAG: hypothetical protein MRERC_4c126 [Mycoplasmataceae bacterium RC_NB112A]